MNEDKKKARKKERKTWKQNEGIEKRKKLGIKEERKVESKNRTRRE